MKTKTLVTICFLLVGTITAQAQDDGEFITSYIQSIAPISNTDEGDLSKDKWRQQKIKSIDEGKLPFFFLPASTSASVNCVDGDCINGAGTAKYPLINATYIGFFKDGYPNDLGVLKNSAGIDLYTTMNMGEMDGWQAFDIETRPIFSSLQIKAFVGRIAEVKNFYWDKIDMYYTGQVNGLLKPNAEEAEVSSSKFKGTIKLDYDGNIIEYNGTTEYGAYIYDGPLTRDFKFRSGGKLVSRDGKVVITPRISRTDDGKIFTDIVKIEKGDTLYAGETNTYFQPHGRGALKVNGEEIYYGEWKNGNIDDAFSKPIPSFNESPKENSVVTAAMRKQLIEHIDQRAEVDGLSDRYIYKGSPRGSFTVEAKYTSEVTAAIFIFNLSTQRQNICITPKITGRGKICRDVLPMLIPNHTDKKLNLTSSGVSVMRFHFPKVNEPYTIEITGADPKDYYIIVKAQPNPIQK